MTKEELALELLRVISDAPTGERSLMAILFGIKHHRHLDNQKVAEILGMVNLQGGSINYDVAISRGIHLAKYVTLKSGQYQARAELTKDINASNVT